jgi:hypothetical protein
VLETRKILHPALSHPDGIGRRWYLTSIESGALTHGEWAHHLGTASDLILIYFNASAIRFMRLNVVCAEAGQYRWLFNWPKARANGLCLSIARPKV